jgi:imidazolonepropionase
MSILIIHNAAELVTAVSHKGQPRRGREMRELTVLHDASLQATDGIITWIGPASQMPSVQGPREVIDATGKTVIPGLVDSHTHLVWAGSRENEFEQRLEGRTYQEIAAAGGGIQATVDRLRSSGKEELKHKTRRRLQRLLRFGVTTIEIKSGYGLDLESELKSLQVVAELNMEGPWELVPTFLGAHSVPREYVSHRWDYVHMLVREMLSEIARQKLAEFCDVFCEAGAFSLAESETILTRARDLGLRLKIHADELSPLGGAELAARLGATSADHLLCVSGAGIDALARCGTVATLLPGTAFFLGVPYAPARRLIDGGAAVALATDCNPGTCPSENLPLAGSMACTQMKMRPAEVLTGLTLNAAAALDRAERIGSLEVGKQADLLVLDAPNHVYFFYHFGVDHVWRVVKRGRVVFAA